MVYSEAPPPRTSIAQTKAARTALVGFAALLTCASITAAEIPSSPYDDKRIGVVSFNAHTITHVYVQRGVATHIALNPNDKIRRTAAGFGSDCKTDNADNRWCIHAEVGDTSIFVRPKSGSSTVNNLEVVTANRHYSFLFEALPEFLPNAERPAFHRVTFTYPEAVAAPAEAAKEVKINAKSLPGLPPKNFEYWMQVMPGGDDIAPTAAYDNAQFTYFKFPNNRLIPSVFAIAADGTETMVSKHVEDDTLVVHRVGKRFILRLDNATVGVWNKAFDQDGIPPAGGTTIPGTVRIVKSDATGGTP